MVQLVQVPVTRSRCSSLKIPRSGTNWLGGGFVRHTNSLPNELKVVQIDCPPSDAFTGFELTTVGE